MAKVLREIVSNRAFLKDWDYENLSSCFDMFPS